MSFPALKDAEGVLNAKRDELAGIFAEAGPEMDMSKVKSISGDSAAIVEHIRTLNSEIEAHAKTVEGLMEVKRAAEGLKGAGPRETADESAARGAPREAKSFGRLFLESDAYKLKSGKQGPSAVLDVELKTLMTQAAGFAPQAIRTGTVVESAQRPIQVTDLIPQTTTTQNAVVFMEETTFTNNAAEASEGGTYGEAALVFTERTSSVRKIAVFLPVTDEQLEDVALAESYINNRLPFMVRQRLDSQILVGDGSAPNLRGFLNVSGVQTQAKSTDATPDAVYKAMTKVRVTGRAMPGAVVVHPTNWQDVKLLKTADGIYIWGSPSEAGPDRIWGLPVVQSDAITLGTALVGDFAQYSELSVRRGIDVQVSNSHSTYFVEGKQALRADMRAAFLTYRAAAFCTVTGL